MPFVSDITIMGCVNCKNRIYCTQGCSRYIYARYRTGSEVGSGGEGVLVGGVAEVSQVISKIISKGEQGQSKAKKIKASSTGGR
jgi:alanine dehydrogenase